MQGIGKTAEMGSRGTVRSTVLLCADAAAAAAAVRDAV